MSRTKVAALVLTACVTLTAAGLPWGHVTREHTERTRDRVTALEILTGPQGATALAELSASHPPLSLATSTRALSSAASAAGLSVDQTSTQVRDTGVDVVEVTWTVHVTTVDGSASPRAVAGFVAGLDPQVWAVSSVLSEEGAAVVVLTTRHLS